MALDKHAITIIGHTKGWGKEISPGDSYNFIDGFIINDDNYLPYQKLLKKEAERNGYCSNFNLEDVDSFIVPLYEKIYFSAEYVESLSEAVFSDQIFGVNALSKHIRKNEIVKRLYPTSSKYYKMERRMKNMPFEISCLYCELQMPKFIWVCEISTPELYSKREVVGEIIFDATANHCDRFSFLAIHYPDFMVINDRDYLLDDPNRFLTGTGRLKIESIQSYPMYMNNLKEV